MISIFDLRGYPFKEEDYDHVEVFYSGAFGGLTGPLNKNGIYKAKEFIRRIKPFYMKITFPNPEDEEMGVVATLDFDLWDWLNFSGGKLHSFRGTLLEYI